MATLPTDIFSTPSPWIIFAVDFKEYDFYTKVAFKKNRVRLNFWKLHRLNGISLLANRFPLYYEKLFAFIFPAMNIEFELEVIKEP